MLRDFDYDDRRIRSSEHNCQMPRTAASDCCDLVVSGVTSRSARLSWRAQCVASAGDISHSMYYQLEHSLPDDNCITITEHTAEHLELDGPNANGRYRVRRLASHHLHLFNASRRSAASSRTTTGPVGAATRKSSC